MAWPLSQDYNEAVQNPQTSFNDPELRQGRAVTNALGLPAPCTGNFADVYAVECPARHAKWAVKCFTREVRGLRERYSEISKYLHQTHLPFVVDFQYLEQGIRVGGHWYPIVKMHWVEGFTLNTFVRNTLDRPATLDALLRIWVRMAQRLREARLAHCDIQHGNVLLVPGSTAQSLAVKLIDYDGLWVPALARTPSGEAGHAAFQHPRRLREGAYNATLDRFPLLVAATALRCLRVAGQSLWDRFDVGDNLLFRESDFLAPVKSPLFYELLKLSDPLAHKLVGHTLDALKGPLEAVPLLDELVPELAAPAEPAQRTSVPSVPPPMPGSGKTNGPKSGVRLAEQSAPAEDFTDLGAKRRRRARRRPKSDAGLAALVALLLLAVAGAGAYFAFHQTAASNPEAVAGGGPHTGPKRKQGDHTTTSPRQREDSSSKKAGQPKGKTSAAKKPVRKDPAHAEKPAWQPGENRPAENPNPVKPVAMALGDPSRKTQATPLPPPAPEPPPQPKTPADHTAEAALAPLREQLRKPGADLDRLRRDLYAFRFTHPGTPAALEAARLLARLRSPLDVLDAEKIPEVEHVAAQPMDLVAVVGEHRGRHGGFVQALAYSKDGKFVVSGGTAFTRIWDAETMHLRSVLTYPDANPGVTSVALTRDGNTLAVSGKIGTVQVWNIKNKDLPVARFTIRAGTPAYTVAIDPEGKMLAVGCGNGRIRFFDITGDKAKEVASVEGHDGGVLALTYAANGTWLASGGGDQAVRLWSFNKGKPGKPLLVDELLGGPVMSLAFSPDGKLLAAGGQNNCNRLWEVPPAGGKPRLLQALPTRGNWVFAMSFANTGKMLAAAGGDGIVRGWSIAGGRARPLEPLPVSKQAVFALAFSPAGKRLVTGGTDWMVRSWDTTNGKPIERFKVTSPRTLIWSVAFSPDGKYLATGADDSSVCLWDLSRYPLKAQRLSYEGVPINSVAFSPDGTLVAASNKQGTLRQWLVSTGAARASCTNHPGPIGAIVYLPDSKRILTGGGKSLVLWDGTRGRELQRFNGHTTLLGCMALSPDGKVAVSGAGGPRGKGKAAVADSDLFVWDVDTGKKLFALPVGSRIYSAGFAPDGRHLYAGADEAKLRHWQLEDGRWVEGKPFIAEGNHAMRTLPTPDGRHVLTFGFEGHLQLRDARKGDYDRQWEFPEMVGDVALSPEGRHVAVSLATGVVYILRLDEPRKEP